MIEDKTLRDVLLTRGSGGQNNVSLRLRDVLDSVIDGRADGESAVGDELKGPLGEPVAAWDGDGLLGNLHLVDGTGCLVVDFIVFAGKFS